MDLETHNLIEPKVLIADDEYPNRLLIETILGNAGISTVCVSNGIEALEQIEKQEFALVILDIQMPEMDGFQLLKKIHSAPKSQHLPVIFVSAVYSITEYQEIAIASGAVDFLSKPINSNILIGKVRVFIDLFVQKKQIELYRNNLEQLVKDQYSELLTAKERAEDADKLKTAFLNIFRTKFALRSTQLSAALILSQCPTPTVPLTLNYLNKYAKVQDICLIL